MFLLTRRVPANAGSLLAALRRQIDNLRRVRVAGVEVMFVRASETPLPRETVADLPPDEPGQGL